MFKQLFNILSNKQHAKVLFFLYKWPPDSKKIKNKSVVLTQQQGSHSLNWFLFIAQTLKHSK